MAVNLDTLHDWLLAATRGVGPQTTVELMADLDTLRRVNPGPYSDAAGGRNHDAAMPVAAGHSRPCRVRERTLAVVSAGAKGGPATEFV